MPAKISYDLDKVFINDYMSEREKKIFSLLKEGRDYKFIAKQLNLAASDIGKSARKYIKKKICQQTNKKIHSSMKKIQSFL